MKELHNKEDFAMKLVEVIVNGVKVALLSINDKYIAKIEKF